MTGWIILAFALAIAAVDVWLLVRRGYEATISAFTIRNVYRRPYLGVLVGLAIGVLLGHLFWGQPCPINR